MKLIDIPKYFHSDASGEPFQACIHCGRKLHEPGTHYFVEKAIRNYPDYNTTDTIFEYAICFDCYMDVHQSLSAQSKSAIDNYFMQHVSILDRLRILRENESPDIENWLSRCLIKNIEKQHTSEYQIMCECFGDKLMLSFAPYLVSMEAMHEIADLLSNQTLDSLNGFYDKHLGVPPEFQPLLTDHPHLIL